MVICKKKGNYTIKENNNKLRIQQMGLTDQTHQMRELVNWKIDQQNILKHQERRKRKSQKNLREKWDVEKGLTDLAGKRNKEEAIF